MTPQSPPPPLRTVSFGATGPGAWGAAWLPGPDAPGLLILGRGAEAQTLTARLEADEPDGRWQVDTEAGRLMIEPAGEPVEMVPRDGSPSGLQQLCRVSGDALGAGRRAEQAFGRRGECVAAGALERYDSIREVSAWFADDEAATVIALRPRKQRGHEQDEVGGVVIVPEGWGPVVDPRLSTTYTAAGEPTRVGLELWPEDPEQHPRRLAGESLGPGVWAAAGGWELLAQPMQCHSRGRDGIGVYLIARHA